MDKSGLINLKGESRDYGKFFLERNPFPSLAIPEHVPAITADREVPIKRFKDSINELVTNGSTTITVIVGPYGSGKSHLFKIFKQSVNTQLLSPNNGAIAVYIKSPGNDFSDLFFSIVDDLGRSFLGECATRITAEHIKSNKNGMTNYFDEAALKNFMKSEISLDTLLTSPRSQFGSLSREVRKAKLASVKDDDLAFAFLSLAHPEYSSRGWKWLIGGTLDKLEKEQIKVSKDIRDPSLAFSLFDDLVMVLHIAGIKSLVLLVDELEKITFLSKTARVEYQDTLRQWIDGFPRDTCFYFAIAPYQWDLLVKEPTALVRRLSGNWYVLKKFENEEIKELVEKYLYASRIDPYESKDAKKNFPKCSPSLAPFTDESIPVLQEKSGGTVSSILLLCRKCLEYLHDEFSKYKAVTPELVMHVSKEEGFD